MSDTADRQPETIKRIPDAPDYGPWVPDFLVKTMYLISFGLLVMTIIVLFVFGDMPIGLACVAITVVGFSITLYIVQIKKLFRPGKNSIMTKLHHYLLGKLDWDGQGSLLDVGAGNAELAIRCAFNYPDAQITASDHWDRAFMEWGYSNWQCKENARLEEVEDRILFVPGANERLEFDDETFDAVVSCFIRMDTGYETHKREQVLEALRVLKTGGRFSLMGMYKHEELYGDMNRLIEELKDRGVSEIHYQPDIASLDFVPKFAAMPLMIGKAGLIYGVK